MIVSCPSCSTRYRIRADRFKGSRARITCKKCGHKFIVNKEEPAPAPPPPSFEEDDEDEVPTAVMPHGSQVIRKIRESTADIPFPHESAAPPNPSTAPPPQAPMGSTPIAPAPTTDKPAIPAGLKAEVRPGGVNVPKTQERGGSMATYIVVAVFFLVVVIVATLVMSGTIPLPV